MVCAQNFHRSMQNHLPRPCQCGPVLLVARGNRFLEVKPGSRATSNFNIRDYWEASQTWQVTVGLAARIAARVKNHVGRDQKELQKEIRSNKFLPVYPPSAVFHRNFGIA